MNRIARVIFLLMAATSYAHCATATYQVQKGDNLFVISRKFHTKITVLRKLNGLKSSMLRPGDTLLVPVLDSEKKTSMVSLNSASQPVLAVIPVSEPATRAARQTDVLLSFSIQIDKAAITVVNKAMSFIGVPYCLGGYGNKGIDCSGLVKNSYEAAGINLPRTAQNQFQEGVPVSRSQLAPGDLLFFSSSGKTPTHVAIYMGEGMVIHANSGSGKVVMQDIERTPFLKRTFIGARRILLPIVPGSHPPA